MAEQDIAAWTQSITQVINECRPKARSLDSFSGILPRLPTASLPIPVIEAPAFTMVATVYPLHLVKSLLHRHCMSSPVPSESTSSVQQTTCRHFWSTELRRCRCSLHGWVGICLLTEFKLSCASDSAMITASACCCARPGILS